METIENYSQRDWQTEEDGIRRITRLRDWIDWYSDFIFFILQPQSTNDKIFPFFPLFPEKIFCKNNIWYIKYMNIIISKVLNFFKII